MLLCSQLTTILLFSPMWGLNFLLDSNYYHIMFNLVASILLSLLLLIYLVHLVVCFVFLCAISCCSPPSGLKCQTDLWDFMRMQRDRRVAGAQCSPSIWGGELQCLCPAIQILDVGFELFDIKLGEWFFIPHFPWYSAGFSIDKLNIFVLGVTGEISGNHLVFGFTSGSHPLSFPGGGWNQPR
jgi:hypothetical protein